MQQVSQLIFKINTANGSGSAFYLKQHNIFITDYHVVQGAKSLAIEDKGLNRFVGNVVLTDASEDIAFVRAVTGDFSALPEISFSDLANIALRDEVYVLGYPYGMPYTETQGIVSSPKQLMDGKYYIQTDASVNPGNSGGPLVNKNGEIIGITTAKFADADNMGFAIPVDTLKELIHIYTTHQPQQYSIVCPSCKSVIDEPSEYCNNCGDSINIAAFEEKELSALAKLIEEGFATYGINPVLARAGNEYWCFHSGSSLIRMFVYSNNYLYATSPINKMASKQMPELLKYLLSPAQRPYQLGVYDGSIYLSYRVHISDLFNEKYGKQELEKLIKLSSKADDTDNFLLDTYGCPLAAEAKAV